MLRSRIPGTVVAAALALAGCTGGGAEAPSAGESQASESPTVHRATTPPRPDRDACYRLTYDDAVAPSSEAEPVGCRQRHNARTFHVGSLDLVVGDRLVAVDSERARSQVRASCDRRFAEYVGGSAEDRRLTMLATSWFRPTIEQSDAGQAWFRCDLIATSAPGRLAPLTGRLRGVLDSGAAADRWGRCATAKPGREGAQHVICSSRRAAWRAVATVDVPAGTQGRYPGVAAAKEAGNACEDTARGLTDDPLTFTWGYEWPTKEQWLGGRRYGFCWMPE
jgi:hypothetical protein